jgi:hypothetical protein
VLIVTLCSMLLAGAATTAVPADSADPLSGQNLQEPLGHDGPQSMYLSTVGGIDRTTTVDEVMLGSSPRWLPATPVPELPLSIEEAIEASRVVLGNSVGEPSKWGITQVALERFGLSCIYVVRWRPIAGGTKDFFQIPVLMTGRAIAPDPRREPPK